MINKIQSGIAHQEEMNRKYPNRHKEIHKACCKECPTVQSQKLNLVDPEAEEISTYPKEIIAKNFLFVCYKRESKLCKGLCDYYGIDKEFIDNNIEDNF